MSQEQAPLIALSKYAEKYRKLQVSDLAAVSDAENGYASLRDGQVRLLKLCMDPETKRLLCDLEVHDLAACKKKYNALSYCWGNSKTPYEMQTTSGQVLKLTESAAEIMLYVVPNHAEDLFWVDQLCINQADLSEKSTQVAMMGEIFASSKQVLAWLGRGQYEFTKYGLRYAKHLVKHGVPYNYDLFKWNQLIILLGNPWFRRMWIMQEVVMAPTVARGHEDEVAAVRILIEDHAVDFDVFEKAMNAIEFANVTQELLNFGGGERGFIPKGYLSTLTFSKHRGARLSVENQRHISISDVLADAWSFESTDPRDKIFAVNNFAMIPAHLKCHPDYETPAEQVFTQYATQLIPDNPLLLLMAGIGRPRSSLELPSWVPDFSVSSSTGIQVAATREAKYQAGGTNINIAVVSKHLRLQVICIDTVDRIFEQPSKNTLYDPTPMATNKIYFRAMLSWLDSIKQYLSTVRSNNDPPPQQILEQTIAANHLAKTPRMAGSDYQQDSQIWYQIWYRGLLDQAGLRDLKGWVRRFFAGCPGVPMNTDRPRAREMAVRDDPVFVTRDTRLLGFGPQGIRAGDTAVVAMGVPTPLLLREDVENTLLESEGAEERRWKLVGGCFIHGLMYGDGLSMGQLESFVLV